MSSRDNTGPVCGSGHLGSPPHHWCPPILDRLSLRPDQEDSPIPVWCCGKGRGHGHHKANLPPQDVAPIHHAAGKECLSGSRLRANRFAEQTEGFQ